MGLILCKTKESKKPYVIKNMGQCIYSLEELSYYIYNNVYLVGSDLIDDSLIEYIKTELKEERLAANLTTLILRKANLSELVVCILRYVDYYSSSEISHLKEIIDSMNSKNVLERIGARADNLLKNNCCHSAIKNYDMIINSLKDESLPDVFYGNVYHNMGVAYGKLFMYEEAFNKFFRAYEILKSEESKKQAYIAAWLYKYQNGKPLVEMQEEEAYSINHEIETLMNDAVGGRGYERFKEAMEFEALGRNAEYYEAIKELIESYEMNYKELSN